MYHANQQLFVPPKNKAIPIVNPNTSQIVDIVHKPKVASIANPTTVIIDQTPRPIKIVNPNVSRKIFSFLLQCIDIYEIGEKRT